MDDTDVAKAPKADNRQVEAREARLAQALRANLKRRKAADVSPTSIKAPGAKDTLD
jgi:hypothetical protein